MPFDKDKNRGTGEAIISSLVNTKGKKQMQENTRYKVLLVEDNEIERRAFERFVETNDIPYDYVVAGSVTEAKRQLAMNQSTAGPEYRKFDIVISDHDLGDGTAIDVLRLADNIPVIVVTGAGDEETAINTWKAGAYDYLIKDIDQNYLKAIPITVENAINHKIVEEKIQLLSGAIRSTEDSVYITNMRGEIIFVNKAFCKTYGYLESEIVGKNSSILWISRNQSENTRSVFQTRSPGGGWEVAFYHKRKDDSIFPVSLSRSTIKDANKKDVAIVGVARDISERLLVEDELRSTTLKLQKRIQTQNEITIIALEAIQRLQTRGQTNKAAKVISDLLDISKINAGTIELNRTNFDFALLVEHVHETLSSFAREKNIELTNLCPVREPIFINADYDRVAQVLLNLLLTSIRLSSPNSEIRTVVTSDANTDSEQRGNAITVEIHNPAYIERRSIHRLTNSSHWITDQFSNSNEDIALSLRISKELIEMHSGSLWTQHSQDMTRPSGLDTMLGQHISVAASGRSHHLLCFSLPKCPSQKIRNRLVNQTMETNA
ncbi:MAG: PAS domain S-box protein [Sedimentisphaerales bacterium]